MWQKRCWLPSFAFFYLLLLSLSLLEKTFGEVTEECEFLCTNGHCISKLFVCDQDDDCGDMTDEQDCPPIDRQTVCPSDQFQCLDKLCIPESWVCDGKQDCLDGSDETDGCENAECVDGFTCKNHLCIPTTWVCDGEDDCGDHSDEESCTTQRRDIHISNCTLENQLFKCKDESMCIELLQTCNGHAECSDNSDEGGMCSQADLCKTVNCSNECHVTPQGPVCTCPKGYAYSGNKCEDIDECTIYGICDQKCRNQKGNYSCFCEPGYYLDADNHTCRAEDAEGLLLFSSMKQIRAYFLHSGVYLPVVSNLSQITAVTYDGNHVYWTSVFEGEEAIMRATDHGANEEVLVTAGLGLPEDMALDWLTKNIYFTDSKMQHIGVCSNDGVSCVVLHNRDIDKPRGIALQPAEGLMYWSDWGEKPLIARSGMDGSEPTAFISNNLHWPNGLAIDHGNERLYWVDAKLLTIESIKLDGTDRRVVLSESIKHPYSIAVFEDSIYWSDWEGREIQACNKFTGKNRRRIVREKKNRIFGVHVYHPSMRNSLMSNPCADSGCSDLCLVAPVSKPLRYTCACPEDKVLAPNGHFCTETRKKNAVIVGAGHTLVEIEHKRLGRQTLSEIQVSHVDKIGALAYDSLAGNIIISDAANRKIVTLDINNMNEGTVVTEGIGKISGMDFDPYGHNLYWTDSEHRTVEVISLNTYERTIVISDLGGEIPMDVALVPTDGVMFVALSGPDGTHIDKWSMNGDSKSRSHVIERELIGPQISLTYDRELHQLFWADPLTGYIERVDLNGLERHRFRELIGVPADIATVDGDVFWTNRASSLVNWANKYDADATDKEIDLELVSGLDTVKIIAIHGLDSGNNHLCQHENGGCSHLCLLTPNTKVCGCPVGMKLKADNHNCELPTRCQPNEFHCPTGECIPESLRCNHHYDCPKGDDELNCDHFMKQCPRGQFSCRNGEACVNEQLKCNGYSDCRDGSDESNCPRQGVSQCADYDFTCNSGECIPSSLHCDNIIDCADGSDEADCLQATCNPVTQFQCSSGQCIPARWECDMEVDCADKSDEHSGCSSQVTCGPDQIICDNRNCVDKELMCDGNDDCGDNTDEMNCADTDDDDYNYGVVIVHPGSEVDKSRTQTCIEGEEFACESQPGVCLPIQAKCNGTSECLRGEDENDCGCTEDQFKCANSDRCILKLWVCDKTNDCGDNSDEDPHLCQFVSKNNPVGKHMTDIHTICNEFQCRNKKCLSFTKVCDGRNDCGDSSDEGGLCGKNCAMAGCSDHCQETPVGFHCSCFHGYKLLGDGKTCTDIDECTLGTYCAQDCHNTPGSYSCECRHVGYQLKDDRMSCKAVGSEMQIIYVLEDKIRYVSKSQTSLGVVYTSRLADLRVSGLDVDARRHLVYWSSDVTGVLSRISLENRSNIEMISNIQRPSKISLDWVTENVYFVESSKQIKVCHFTIQKCALIYTADTDVKIYALAVDPISRTMFWSESSGFGHVHLMPKSIIKTSDLSGSSIRIVVDTSLEYVVDIAIDNIHNKIFWIDQMLKTVETATFDGTDRDVLFHSPEEPIEVELFEDSIYWMVRSRSPQVQRDLQVYGNVWQCGLFGPTVWNCDHIKIHPRNMLGSPYRFKIMQEALQQEDNNDCKNIACTHVCVLTASEPICLCEDGSQVAPGRQCRNITTGSSSSRLSFTSATLSSSSSPSSTSSSKEGSDLWWLLFVFIFVFVLLPAVIIVLYVVFQQDIHKYFQDKPNKFMFSSIHFQNPSYGMSHRESPFHHSRLSPGHHQYVNPITDKVDEENVYIVHANEMKITNGDECNNKKTKVQVIDVADDESSGTEYTDPISESHKAPLIR